MNKNAKVSPPGVQARVSPLGFHMYSSEFLDALIGPQNGIRKAHAGNLTAFVWKEETRSSL